MKKSSGRGGKSCARPSLTRRPTPLYGEKATARVFALRPAARRCASGGGAERRFAFTTPYFDKSSFKIHSALRRGLFLLHSFSEHRSRCDSRAKRKSPSFAGRVFSSTDFPKGIDFCRAIHYDNYTFIIIMLFARRTFSAPAKRGGAFSYRQSETSPKGDPSDA